ncbi:Yrm1p KNAG_0M01040 [Huiozyma naganishii CBS 8797]|uniref:Zn(2)-C6 fungal-type domain-containing protein n=1 Tax=Huiozyma naganishii (strain ATCC MYA-139 / BCRC 22969 / CBS 8797 / KCTC 17520 / NBRC 10181 / NCYC 3082 / Yp74L-3) TaxID=1071383 RepID=J7S420_HUIN7|nr:hypothetical protein KNAG_0M01040 [Kazachstania naganishii CBS 8797]CCK72957.1 hypothetical protein KNAG_0M01040 [Kazachstania naganishii CBS 8797]
MDTQHTRVAKQRRRKRVKSCLFCRHRKLKCDQAVPLCSSCKVRNKTVCIYADSPDDGWSPLDLEREALCGTTGKGRSKRTTVTVGAGTGPVAPIVATQGFEPLKAVEQYIVTPREWDAAKNSFADYLHCRGDGQMELRGPLAVLTLVQRSNPGFYNKWQQLWNKVDYSRGKWFAQLAPKFDPWTSPFTTGPVSLLNVCRDLPTFEQILVQINVFFHAYNSELYLTSTALDQQKVLNIFYNSFTPDNSRVLPNGERPVLMLRYDQGGNYYKVGIILMILQLTFYHYQVPESIQRVSKQLVSADTDGIFYMERLQFLLLSCHYQQVFFLHKFSGDSSTMTNLISQLTAGAVSMGLHKNISKVYKGQEPVVGNLRSIENLWSWILLSDLQYSLHFGKPLTLTSDTYDYPETGVVRGGGTIRTPAPDAMTTVVTSGTNLQDLTKDFNFYSRLSRLLKLARPILTNIHNKRLSPSHLPTEVERVLEFIEREFPNLSQFTRESTSNVTVSIHDYFILGIALTLVISLNALFTVTFESKPLTFNNDQFQTLLFSLNFVKHLLLKCQRMDQERFGSNKNAQYTLKYLPSSTFTVQGLWLRTIGTFHAFMYWKITHFSQGVYFTCDSVQPNWPADNLRPVNKGTVLNLMTCYHAYIRAMQHLALDGRGKANSLRNLLDQIPYYSKVMAMENVLRTIVEEAISYRREAESKRIIPAKYGLFTSFMLKDPQPSRRNDPARYDPEMIKNAFKEFPTTSLDKDVPRVGSPFGNGSSSTNVSGRRSSNSTSGGVGTGSAGSTGGDCRILADAPGSDADSTAPGQLDPCNLLEEEFWSNYNVGWEKLLDSTDTLQR